MGQPVSTSQFYTLEEYFEISAKSEIRYEYEHGELVGIGRTSDTHSELMINISSMIKSKIKGKGCKVYAETVSLEAEEANSYYLPDVMLTCDPRDHADRNMKRYPSLVAEILSPESFQRDREDKFQGYLKMPSLQYYLIVSQNKVRVEVFGKMKDGPGWNFHYFESLEDVIQLDQLDIDIKVADIYEDVTLIPSLDDKEDEIKEK